MYRTHLQAGLLLTIVCLCLPLLVSEQASQALQNDALTTPPTTPPLRVDAQSDALTVGLLPVDFAPLPGTAQPAALLELQIASTLRAHQGITLIGPDTMGRWTKTMRMSRIDRSALQAGAIAGASLLVVPRLVHRQGGFLTHLKLIDTATGAALWEVTHQGNTDPPITALLDQLLDQIDSAPAVSDDTIDLAMLLPYDAQAQARRKPNWRAQAMQTRWKDGLTAADPRLRILDPDLADFVSRDAINRRTGLFDNEQPAQVVRSPIVIETRLDAPYNARYAFEDAPYHLTLTVRDSDWQQEIIVKGTSENAAQIEAQALNKLLAIIAQRRGIKAKRQITAVGDDTYRQARALMYEAETSAVLEFDSIHDRLNTADGRELIKNVLHAVKALPGSKESLSPLSSITDGQGIYMSAGLPADHPMHELRELIKTHYAGTHLTGRFLAHALLDVYDFRNRKPKDDNPAALIEATQLAKQWAQDALTGESPSFERYCRLLLHAGEGQLAMDAAVSLVWQQRGLGQWSLLNTIVTEAVAADQMDLAFKAYSAQLRLMPNYHGERNMRHKTILPKLLADDQKTHRWSKLAMGLLDGKDRLDQRTVKGKQIQADYYEAMAGQERWEQIAREALEDLRTDPPLISASTNYQYSTFDAYLMALEHLLKPEAYEQRLIDIIYGELPEVKGGWNTSVVMRNNAKRLRDAAAQCLTRLWAGQRRFNDILEHPMLGTWLWYSATSNSQWELYLYADQPERALAAIEYEYERTRGYLYTGQFEKALQVPLTQLWNQGSAYAKAAVLARDAQAFDKAIKFFDKESKDPLPLLIQYFQLLHKDTVAMQAWAAGYEAEFMGDTDQAIKAYQQGVLDHPNTFAAAEAMFRVGELLLLDKGIDDKAQFWFSESAVTHERVANQTRDAAIQAWSRYRVGQVAFLTQDDPDTARQAWALGNQAKGPGKQLCAWALSSLAPNAPAVRVGDHRGPPASRIVDIDLDAQSIYVELNKLHLHNKVSSHIFAPIGLDHEMFQAWTDDQESRWSGAYLWYRYNNIRPGFALVYAATPDSTDAVWCKLKRNQP